MVIASNSGSQLPHLVYTSPNLILVAGTHKITPNLEAAIKRVREYVYPLENQRMKDAGMGGSAISKLLLFEREPAFMGRKVRVIFVNEKLGFSARKSVTSAKERVRSEIFNPVWPKGRVMNASRR